MLTCLACLRRAFLPLPLKIPTFDTWEVFTPTRLNRRVKHSTWASIQKGHHVREIRKHLKRASRPGKATTGENATAYSKKISKPVQRTLLSRVANNKTYDLTMSVDAKSKGSKTPTEGESNSRALREIQYLRDPHRLASHVQRLLRHGEVQFAYDLVLVSQNAGLRNIVSWNHLLDYHMSKGMVSEALKYYNHMKKRGTRPDSHTYTIMLRGLAQNHEYNKAASHALSIYTSMKAANSIAKPAIIHHNCMLNVCNKTGDMDALFGVAGGMPERGPNSPDAWSYAIILSALMSQVHKLKTMHEKGDEEREASITRAMTDGRKLWEDVIRRWRAGEISVDESLVSAMASLFLASGRDSDTMDVFSLVQQTTNIAQPKLPQISNSPATIEDEIQSRTEAEDTRMSSTASSPTTGFVKPGNSILNYLLRAARQLRSRKLGDYYWNRIINPDAAVDVDFGNLCEFLHLLCISHSSTRAVEILRRLGRDPSVFHTNSVAKPSSYPFFLAIEACRRDKNSQHAFSNANAALDIMQSISPDPDPKILRIYLLIARITTPGLPTYSPAGQIYNRRKRAELKFNPKPSHNHLIQALRRVVPDALKLRRLVDETNRAMPDPLNPISAKDKDEQTTQKEAIRDERTRLLAQDMERDCTRLISKGLEEADEWEFDELRKRVAGWLGIWDKFDRKMASVKKMRRLAPSITSTVREKGKGEKKLKVKSEGDNDDVVDSAENEVADRALKVSEIRDRRRAEKVKEKKKKEESKKTKLDEPVQPNWGAGWAEFAQRASANTKAWVTA